MTNGLCEGYGGPNHGEKIFQLFQLLQYSMDFYCNNSNMVADCCPRSMLCSLLDSFSRIVKACLSPDLFPPYYLKVCCNCLKFYFHLIYLLHFVTKLIKRTDKYIICGYILNFVKVREFRLKELTTKGSFLHEIIRLGHVHFR